MTWEVREGHVLDVLRSLEAESVQCVVTSPPYWGLRDYGLEPQDWGDWSGSLGLEPTPDLFVEHIVRVFREVRRVLRKDGTVWLNLGDSYAGGGVIGRNDTTPEALARRAERFGTGTGLGSAIGRQGTRSRVESLKPKDLIGIPWRVAFALQADGWWLRSDIVWSKPNPMPESVTDRPTRAHEYVFLLTKSARYFYDADAVRESMAPSSESRYAYAFGGAKNEHLKATDKPTAVVGVREPTDGRNLRSVWNIPTEPFPEAHFATFPKKLVEPCVKAGTSEKGCCSECGAPWVRVVERSGGTTGKSWHSHQGDGAVGQRVEAGVGNLRFPDYRRNSRGFVAGCKHDAKPIPCTVLDPFCGSGTVGVVSRGLGRRFVGIELSPVYADMARRRISGMKRGLDEDGTPLWQQDTMFS